MTAPETASASGTPAPGPALPRTALRGTGALARLVLRRDRMLLPWWTVVLGLIPVSLGRGIAATAPTVAERLDYARVSRANATFTALYGPLYDSGIGALTAWRNGFVPVMVGLFSALTVIRHTRTEEEAGRRELVGSTVVGRHAPVAAALLVTLAADLVLGVVVALGMIGWGQPVAGSLAFGLALATAGWVFAAAAAVAAQVTESAAAARGLALGVVGAAFVLRMVGDAPGSPASWLSWLSPVAWSHEVHPYAGDRWWVLVLPLAATAAGATVATVLSARRDLGSGLVPPRPGPASAPAGLAGPAGLAWRLQRGTLLAWLCGQALLGLVFGSVADSVGDVLRDNSSMQELFARLGGRTGLIDSYLAAVLPLVGLIAAAQAVQAALRLRIEEAERRVEPVLGGGAVSRRRWLAGHLPYVLLGPAAGLALAGAITGAVHGAMSGDVAGQLGRCLGGALLQVPAVWVVAGLALAAFGLVPRFTAAVGWGAEAACVLIGLLGTGLQLSRWVLGVSPFSHVPHYPGGAVSALPVVVLGAVAVALAALGWSALRRRDIPVG